MAGGKISPGRMSEAESILDGQRMSLYDVVDENNKTMNRKGIINRIVVAAQLHEGLEGNEDLGAYYDKYFKELYNTQNVEPCTGLLLIYPTLCLFVIETSNEMLTEFVKEIHKDEQTKTGNIQRAKICVISHDINQRLYQNFITKVLDIQAQKGDEADPDESVEPVVIEILTQLLKLGNYLAKQPKLSLKNALQTIREKVPDFLPQQDLIFQIVTTNDTSVMTLQEFLDLYSKPFHVVLDSELTWPINTRLFPYN